MIKAFVFDFGGVILNLERNQNFNIPFILANLFRVPLEEVALLWQQNREMLTVGKETPREFLARMNILLNLEMPVEELYRKWDKLSVKKKKDLNGDVVDFIKELRSKYRVYVLSDTSDVGQNDPFNQEIKSWFDGFFVSYEHGFKKPDREAFENFLNQTDLKAEECVFTDDKEKNVLVARELGFRAFTFANLKQFKADLLTLGGELDL